MLSSTLIVVGFSELLEASKNALGNEVTIKNLLLLLAILLWWIGGVKVKVLPRRRKVCIESSIVCYVLLLWLHLLEHVLLLLKRIQLTEGA